MRVMLDSEERTTWRPRPDRNEPLSKIAAVILLHLIQPMGRVTEAGVQKFMFNTSPAESTRETWTLDGMPAPHTKITAAKVQNHHIYIYVP